MFLKDKLQKSVQVEYLNLLERWSIEYEDLFTNLVKTVSEIDVYKVLQKWLFEVM